MKQFVWMNIILTQVFRNYGVDEMDYILLDETRFYECKGSV